MHPAIIAWWNHHHRHGGCGEHARSHFEGEHAHAHEGGPGEGRRGWGRHDHDHGHGHGHHFGPPDHDGGWGASFGVRRPLRFLAHKLELSDEQVTTLASILDALKTERAQAAVDQRRSTSAVADALSADAFDAAKATEVKEERVRSTERLEEAVARALGKIHALLTAEQRKKIAYLIRTGVLSI